MFDIEQIREECVGDIRLDHDQRLGPNESGV